MIIAPLAVTAGEALRATVAGSAGVRVEAAVLANAPEVDCDEKTLQRGAGSCSANT